MQWLQQRLRCAYAQWLTEHLRMEYRRWEHVKCDLGFSPGPEQCEACPHNLYLRRLTADAVPTGATEREPLRGSTIFTPARRVSHS